MLVVGCLQGLPDYLSLDGQGNIKHWQVNLIWVLIAPPDYDSCRVILGLRLMTCRFSILRKNNWGMGRMSFSACEKKHRLVFVFMNISFVFATIYF